ncbi:hypothetical protein DICVIV_06903 [Dictyocaulus viviparus]|uniref:G-protein coupled receptors family 1 profile domain-containing protein n=1 Tax=Dictyocaulus viviparus TaxID=29172 RepID=A0A0D8XXD6_DICVI|nr:hypothetical protein DICVIV_06903 [Dictyocaulus viviparus]
MYFFFRNDNCLGISFYENFFFRSQISLIIIVLMITTIVLYWKMLSRVSEVRSKFPVVTSVRGRRTVITATLIFGTFLFGWAPASILFLLTANEMPLFRKSGVLVNVLSIVVLINIMIKSLTNPIIYATRIPEIRHFVRHRLLWRVIKFREEPPSVRENFIRNMDKSGTLLPENV